jgi:hypothetical protein
MSIFVGLLNRTLAPPPLTQPDVLLVPNEPANVYTSDDEMSILRMFRLVWSEQSQKRPFGDKKYFPPPNFPSPKGNIPSVVPYKNAPPKTVVETAPGYVSLFT